MVLKYVSEEYHFIVASCPALRACGRVYSKVRIDLFNGDFFAIYTTPHF